MMRKILLQLMGVFCLLAILTASGCVAPPEETTTTGPVDLYDPNQFATETSDQSSPSRFVTAATPFETQAQETVGYNTIITQTRPPEDVTCLIYLEQFDWQFYPNKTAFAFDLKNPPMYMNYTIIDPYIIKDTKIARDNTGADKIVNVEYPAPFSYLEITARDKDTGEIYMQDGYGKSYGYYTNNSDIRLSKTGNMLIEVSGYNVSGAIGFWAKPYGNFDANESFDGVECVYWTRSSQL
jgi:hypothetical protein